MLIKRRGSFGQQLNKRAGCFVELNGNCYSNTPTRRAVGATRNILTATRIIRLRGGRQDIVLHLLLGLGGVHAGISRFWYGSHYAGRLALAFAINHAVLRVVYFSKQ